MFTIKKLLSGIILPLPMVFILSVISIISMLKQAPKIAITCLSSILIILIICGFTASANYANKILATIYPPLVHAPDNTTTIVVLSGGSNSASTANPNSNLSTITLCRTIEGVRLALDIKKHKKKVLIIMSAAGNTGINMQKTAHMLGIPLQQIQVAAKAKDTLKQAKSLQQQLQHKPFILVTSAVHMRRAMVIFHQLKMQPIAAPTCYTYKMHNSVPILNYLPMAARVTRFNYAWHEYLGLIWHKLKDSI